MKAAWLLWWIKEIGSFAALIYAIVLAETYLASILSVVFICTHLSALSGFRKEWVEDLE